MASTAQDGGPLLTSRGLSKEEEHLLPIEVAGRNESAHKTASTGGFQVPFPTSWSLNLLAVLPLLPPSQQQPTCAGVFIWSLPSVASSPLADKSFAKERTRPDFSYGTAAFNMQVWLMWVDTLLPAQLLQLNPKHWMHLRAFVTSTS